MKAKRGKGKKVFCIIQSDADKCSVTFYPLLPYSALPIPNPLIPKALSINREE
jgi:hypothetical protein